MAEGYPRTEIGKRVRRADGVMLEEVHVTDFKDNKLTTKTMYRPGKGKKRGKDFL